MDDRPTPYTRDRDTGGHFEAAARRQIAIKVCSQCGNVLHLPRAYCALCRGWETTWTAVAPTGTLWSFTTTERLMRAGFDPPYTVVVVELDDAPGTRLLGYLAGRPQLSIGMKMVATFEDQDGVMIPQWQPSRNEAEVDAHLK